jgi:hypothetical protein
MIADEQRSVHQIYLKYLEEWRSSGSNSQFYDWLKSKGYWDNVKSIIDLEAEKTANEYIIDEYSPFNPNTGSTYDLDGVALGEDRQVMTMASENEIVSSTTDEPVYEPNIREWEASRLEVDSNLVLAFFGALLLFALLGE